MIIMIMITSSMTNASTTHMELTSEHRRSETKKKLEQISLRSHRVCTLPVSFQPTLSFCLCLCLSLTCQLVLFASDRCVVQHVSGYGFPPNSPSSAGSTVSVSYRKLTYSIQYSIDGDTRYRIRKYYIEIKIKFALSYLLLQIGEITSPSKLLIKFFEDILKSNRAGTLVLRAIESFCLEGNSKKNLKTFYLLYLSLL